MQADYSHFGRRVLEGLAPDERKARMSQLEAGLTARLAHVKNWEDYWAEVHRIIADLRSAGHDLWSHDYDGERKWLWGWDYHPERLDSAGYLQIQFDYQGAVRTFWRTEDPQLGAVN